jgi:hypothetical protein
MVQFLPYPSAALAYGSIAVEDDDEDVRMDIDLNSDDLDSGSPTLTCPGEHITSAQSYMRSAFHPPYQSHRDDLRAHSDPI